MRKFTTRLLEAMDEGLISPKAIAEMALAYMSEAEVKDMCLSNDYTFEDEDEDEDEEVWFDWKV